MAGCIMGMGGKSACESELLRRKRRADRRTLGWHNRNK